MYSVACFPSPFCSVGSMFHTWPMASLLQCRWVYFCPSKLSELLETTANQCWSSIVECWLSLPVEFTPLELLPWLFGCSDDWGRLVWTCVSHQMDLLRALEANICPFLVMHLTGLNHVLRASDGTVNGLCCEMTQAITPVKLNLKSFSTLATHRCGEGCIFKCDFHSHKSWSTLASWNAVWMSTFELPLSGGLRLCDQFLSCGDCSM